MKNPKANRTKVIDTTSLTNKMPGFKWNQQQYISDSLFYLLERLEENAEHVGDSILKLFDVKYVDSSKSQIVTRQVVYKPNDGNLLNTFYSMIYANEKACFSKYLIVLVSRNENRMEKIPFDFSVDFTNVSDDNQPVFELLAIVGNDECKVL